MNVQALILVVIGLFAIICTWKKPAFYWENHKARSMRELIGDRGAELFYYVLGTILCVLGTLLAGGWLR